MSIHYSDETLQQTVEAFSKAGTKAGGARLLGLPTSTFKDRLKAATQRGVTGPFKGRVGEGFMVTGATTLYDAQTGEAKLQWVREKAEENLTDLIDSLTRTFEQYEGMAETPDQEEPSEADWLTVYPLADLHLGMYSWQDETGADFDLEIASKLVKDTVAELVMRSPASEVALLLNLGDFFHADSVENRTRRSGNILDVDTRWAKVLDLGVEIMIDLITLALRKHERVIVRNLQGNHDEHSALALSIALKAYYKGHERVIIDASPNPFFFYEHGKVLIGATHGDKAKPAGLVNIMAAKKAEAWGRTKYRYAYLGHVHQKNLGGGDMYGATWETFQTLAPKDAWANSMGFTAGRSMQSITHDLEKGEIVRLTVNVKGPE